MQYLKTAGEVILFILLGFLEYSITVQFKVCHSRMMFSKSMLVFTQLSLIEAF